MNSGILNPSANILEPIQSLSDHQYRIEVKICIEVGPVGPLVDPHSIHFLGNHLSYPSQLILNATAYCVSCAAAKYASDAPPRYDLPAFPLLPSIGITALDESNTRCSRIGSFDIPPRYQRLSNGQSTQYDQESLVQYVFSLTQTPKY